MNRPFSAEWSNSDFDVRHTFVMSHVVELPFGRGRRYLSASSGVVEKLINGWSLLGFLQLRSGDPFTISLGQDVWDLGAATAVRPGLLGGSLGDVYSNGSLGRVQYLLPLAQASGLLGVPADVRNPFTSIGRNSLTSPGVYVYDASLMKRFAFTERVALNLELNLFNIFNRAQMAAPVLNLANARFGEITGTRPGFTPRQVQIGAKIVF